MRLKASIAVTAALLTASCAKTSKAKALAAANVPQSKSSSLPFMMERQVLNAIDAGDGDYTTKRLREKMAAEPDNMQVRLDLAESYEKRGFADVALEHYRLAAERFPNSPDAQVRLARSLRGLKQPEAAIAGLRKFMTSHEKTANLRGMLGILLTDQGEFKAAETELRSAIVLAPAQDYLHNDLGYNLRLQARNTEAAEAFRKALELNPKSETARNNLAELLRGTPEAAVSVLKNASDPAVVHNNLGAFYIQQGDYRAARKELEVALSYRRDLPQVFSNLKLVSEMDGQPIVLPNRRSGSVWRSITGAFREAFVEPDFKNTKTKESSRASE